MNKGIPHNFRLLACAVPACASVSALAGNICFEAESARKIAPPMEVVRKAEDGPDAAKNPALKGASASCYIRIPEGAGNPPKVKKGEAVYSFEVSRPGVYFLWCRVWWPDECANSFTISVDGNPAFSFGGDATYKRWHWVSAPPTVKRVQLEAGKHVLRIKNREDGAAIDQILLAEAGRYVPVGREHETGHIRPAEDKEKAD
ncbi:MAG: hypothetical protein R6V03_04055 [Kiritimatiellia bacterium]